MSRLRQSFQAGPCRPARAKRGAALLLLSSILSSFAADGQQNLLQNPGFEETAAEARQIAAWTASADSVDKPMLMSTGVRKGKFCVGIPANSSIKQKSGPAEPGAYLARCWVKSEAEQSVTLLVQDVDQPWVAYSLNEFKIPGNEWTRVEAFCALDRKGSLTVTLGGTSKEFRAYHGAGSQMEAPIVADDFELIRYQPKTGIADTKVLLRDAGKDLGATLDWPAREQWSVVGESEHVFSGTPVFEARQLAGTVRKSDGGLTVYALHGGELKLRSIVVPSPGFAVAKYTSMQKEGQTGIRVSSESGDKSYTVWFTAAGLIRVESSQVKQFELQSCRLRYGLLPSFVGSDVCYAPQSIKGDARIRIPSTQWLVGLADGNDSMLVAVWDNDKQAVSLGLSGEGEKRMIDSVSIATSNGGFSLSFVEHAGIWHQEALKEDWLGEYTPIEWERPFPARWMGHLFVTPGGQPNFRMPYMNYSFPIAGAKTRMWGAWFEDWNFYPFFFEGPRTVFHFEKTFVPNGEALLYFLEPAAADLLSPCEILVQALGQEKAAALLDYDANRLRKLKYSTPDQFMYDRPVCATTTRLSQIKQADKGTVGVNLATHLYEFIREIRGRIDQYQTFFDQMNQQLDQEKQAHPEMSDYLAELKAMVVEAQSKSKEIYATPLTVAQQRIDSMKKLLQEGGGDGFDCGKLDVRGIAGSQDDLCRRYNRLVIRLMQTAALKCGDSTEKAVFAKSVWDQSRAVLRQPTRWEPRRTLYFFEP